MSGKTKARKERTGTARITQSGEGAQLSVMFDFGDTGRIESHRDAILTKLHRRFPGINKGVWLSEKILVVQLTPHYDLEVATAFAGRVGEVIGHQVAVADHMHMTIDHLIAVYVVQPTIDKFFGDAMVYLSTAVMPLIPRPSPEQRAAARAAHHRQIHDCSPPHPTYIGDVSGFLASGAFLGEVPDGPDVIFEVPPPHLIFDTPPTY